jgi:hypothetical protein
MSDVIVEQMTVKHNAQQKNEYPLPDEWTDQQRQALVEICGSVMKALGYEAVL